MADNEKQIVVLKTANQRYRTKKIWQYDVGHTLWFDGFNLPYTFEVHFAHSPTGEAQKQIGQDNVCEVPPEYTQNSGVTYAWLYEVTEDTGLTKHQIEIPVEVRATPTDQEPTPAEQSVIDQTIAALNTAVEKAEDAQQAAEDAAESVKNASATAETLSPGSPATVVVEDVEGVKTFRFGIPEGQQGETGATPNFTVGSVTTLPAGSPVTVTITGTAENPVLNIGIPQGAQGYKGDTGAVPHFTIGTVATLPPESQATVTITGADENPVLNLGIPKGVQGQKGDKGDAFTYVDFTEEQKTELIQGPIKTAQDEAIEAVDDEGQRVLDSIPADYSELTDDVSTLKSAFTEHEEYAEDTYAKQDGYYQDMTVGNAEQLVASEFVEDQEPYKLRPSGGSADIGNRENKKAIVGTSLIWNQQVRDEASDNTTEFADIVTVDDAVEDAAAVTVKIEPVQDLHGYDSPWPAGGGKNLLPMTLANFILVNTGGVWANNVYTFRGITFTVNLDDGGNVESIQANGTASDNVEFVLTRNAIETDGDYTVSGCPSGGSSSSYWINFKVTSGGLSFWKQEYGSGVSVTNSTIQNVGAYIKSGASVSNIQFKPMIRLASETDATFAPYSNICPISGWDAVKVTRTGINIWDEEWERGSIDATTGENVSDGRIRSKNLIPVEPGKSYYITTPRTGNDIRIYYYDEYKNYISCSQWIYNGVLHISTAKYIRFIMASGYGTTYNHDISINYPSTDTDYHADGAVYSITFPSEAGTVYGCRLTVNKDETGKVVVDRGSRTFDGSENWINVAGSYPQAFQLDTGVTNAKQELTGNKKHGISNLFEWIMVAAVDNNGIRWQSVSDNGSTSRGRLFVYDATHTSDLAGFKAMLSETPLVIVYDLLTPITYTLTASQVRTLLGTNNIWSDAGQVSLTYTGTDEHLTLEDGHKYLTRINGTDAMVAGSGQELTAVKGRDNVIDLTRLFSVADVADYVYTQGVNYFRAWFPNSLYPYSEPGMRHVEGLQSHDTVGFNLWDEQWEVTTRNGMTSIWTKNYVPVLPNTAYCINMGHSIYTIKINQYDKNKTLIKTLDYGLTNHIRILTTESNCAFILVGFNQNYGSTYQNDVCINLSWPGSRNGEYEPYEKHSYPLDSSLTLRGVPKLINGKPGWDGDRYLPDGTVERRYGVVDLGTLNWDGAGGSYFTANVNINVPSATQWNVQKGMCSIYTIQPMFYIINQDQKINNSIAWYTSYIRIADSAYANAASFKTAMSGVYLVYELAEPTTEQAEPYHETQVVDDWGTEEFVTTGLVPVGHETQYPANLRDKLQHLPDLASSNGIFLVRQTDSEMELLKLPDMPTANGNYRLKLNVASGSPTFSWEVVS